MEKFVYFGISIIIGIIVSKSKQKYRWMFTFVSSLIIIFIGFLLKNKGDIYYIIGGSIGTALVTGTIGFLIGNAIFVPKHKTHKFIFENIVQKLNLETIPVSELINNELFIGIIPISPIYLNMPFINKNMRLNFIEHFNLILMSLFFCKRS